MLFTSNEAPNHLCKNEVFYNPQSGYPDTWSVWCMGHQCAHWRWWDSKDRGDLRRGFCGKSGRPTHEE